MSVSNFNIFGGTCSFTSLSSASNNCFLALLRARLYNRNRSAASPHLWQGSQDRPKVTIAQTYHQCPAHVAHALHTPSRRKVAGWPASEALWYSSGISHPRPDVARFSRRRAVPRSPDELADRVRAGSRCRFRHRTERRHACRIDLHRITEFRCTVHLIGCANAIS